MKPKTIEPSSLDDYFIIAATHFGQTIVTAPYHIVIVKREILPEGNSTFVFVSTEGKELEKMEVENK